MCRPLTDWEKAKKTYAKENTKVSKTIRRDGKRTSSTNALVKNPDNWENYF